MQADYERHIKAVGAEIETAIREVDSAGEGKLTFDQLCALLERLRNEPLSGSEDENRLNELAGELWDFAGHTANPDTPDTVDNDKVYDILIILLGTTRLKFETTCGLVKEYSQKTHGEDFAPADETLANDSRRLFGDFVAHGECGANEAVKSEAEKRYDMILRKHRRTLTRSKPFEKDKVFSIPRANLSKDPMADAFSSIAAPTTSTIAEEWSKNCEADLVKRLAVHKEPEETKQTAQATRYREIEECTHRPNITRRPRSGARSKSPECLPRSYQEAVVRMRKAVEERRKRDERESKREVDTGLRRLQRMKPCPPACFTSTPDKEKKTRSTKKPQRNVLMYVDIKILPGK